MQSLSLRVSPYLKIFILIKNLSFSSTKDNRNVKPLTSKLPETYNLKQDDEECTSTYMIR